MANEDNIIREIETDIAQEKYTRIFTEHGTKLIVAAVAVVAFTGALTVYKNMQVKKSKESATIFMKAFDDADIKQYDEVIAKGQKAYAPMAVLLKADAQKDKSDDAIKTLDSVINNSAVDKAFREKAMIDKAFILINNKGDKAEILKLLDETSKDTAVFNSTALELKASYLLENGDKKTAIELYRKLSKDGSAPSTLQERAKQTLATINE